MAAEYYRRKPLTALPLSKCHSDLIPYLDVTTCNHCGGPVKIIACMEEPLASKKILDHLGAKSAALTSTKQLPETRAQPLP
ncbi:MAG: hypothetical protein V3T17_13545 [Pseudomonadales bacterium]